MTQLQRVLYLGLLGLLASAPARAQYIAVPKFLVGTPTFNQSLQEVDVAVGTDGNVTFLWWEFGQNLGDSNRCVTRLFSPAGISLGAPTRVDVTGRGIYPLIAGSPGGGYVAAWEYLKQGGGHALYTRHLDALGRGVGSEVRVDLVDYGPVAAASVVGLDSGAAYFWKQNGHWIRFYDSLGQPRGPATSVAGNTPGFENDMDVLSDGALITAWTNRFDPSNLSWVRIYEPDGQPRGPALLVDSTGLLDHVAANPNGGFAVVGEDTGAVWLRRFDADGVALGPRQIVRQFTNGHTMWTKPDAVYDSHGNLFVAWHEYDSTTNTTTNPRARTYDASGAPLGADFELFDEPGTELRTARLANDCFVSTYHSYGARVYGAVVCLCSPDNETCGNGTLEGQCERCDDGNEVNGDGCDTNCTVTACGNGVISPGEQCDDGNTSNGDGCDGNCTFTLCGNGVTTAGEECDDGNSLNGDGCESNCTRTGCGNGIPTAGEECDDGNHTNGDGCDANCTSTGCGNSIVTAIEECDDGNVVSGDGCDENCLRTGCGNAVITAGEECDDYNREDGDGCDRHCLIEACGNERVEGNEQCDDGNQTSGDGCDAGCVLPELHDSVVLPVEPIRIAIPAGNDPVTRNVIIQVVNADVEPVRESPGHIIELTASDGDCPAGTISAQPDFQRGISGSQNTTQVDGGLPSTAIADVTVSRATFTPFNHRAPQRCTLWFTATTLVAGSFDPTPDNNIVAVELNVTDTADPQHTDEDEFYIDSMDPTTIKIPSGQSEVVRAVKPVVRRTGKTNAEDPGRDITVTPSDGDCPPGTVGYADFDRRSAGAQSMMRLRRGKRARGTLALVIRSEAFSSYSDEAPRRCTALLTAAGVGMDVDPSNNSTRVVIDVVDRNDY